MSKLKDILQTLLLIGAIAFIAWYMMDSNKREDGKNAQRLLEQDRIEYYRNRDITITARVNTDEATRKNLELILADNKEIKEQVGKLARLQYYNQSAFSSTGTVTNQVNTEYHLRDSHLLVYDTIRKYHYSDGYLDMNCQDINGLSSCTYAYTDTVETVVFLRPLGKWYQFWKWGKKESLTEVTFSNPNAKPVKVKSVLRKSN